MQELRPKGTEKFKPGGLHFKRCFGKHRGGAGESGLDKKVLKEFGCIDFANKNRFQRHRITPQKKGLFFHKNLFQPPDVIQKGGQCGNETPVRFLLIPLVVHGSRHPLRTGPIIGIQYRSLILASAPSFRNRRFHHFPQDFPGWHMVFAPIDPILDLHDLLRTDIRRLANQLP